MAKKTCLSILQACDDKNFYFLQKRAIDLITTIRIPAKNIVKRLTFVGHRADLDSIILFSPAFIS